MALVAFAALFTALAATAQAHVICQISDPADPTLNVRDSPGGHIINQLKNDRSVRGDAEDSGKDAKGQTWLKVASASKGDWRNWGWVLKSSTKCVNILNLPKATLSVKAMRSVGLVPQDVEKSKPLPVSCDIVPNGWGMTLSTKLLDHYRNNGFSEEAICLGFGSPDIHFDPETGKQLPQYKIAGDIFEQVFALTLPDCFKTVEITGKGGYLVTWRPTGCKIRFHPETGFPISDPKVVELSAGGEAGGGTDEDNQSNTISESRLSSIVYGDK